MKLSEQALKELKDILEKDFGQKVENLDEYQLNELGLFILSIDATYMKVSSQL